MKKLSTFTGLAHPDENMAPKYWLNRDNQNHFFESRLHLVYPLMSEPQKIYVCKPGKVTVLPHGYMTVSSRDGTPIRGSWVVGEMVEDFSTQSLEYAEKTN